MKRLTVSCDIDHTLQKDQRFSLPELVVGCGLANTVNQARHLLKREGFRVNGRRWEPGETEFPNIYSGAFGHIELQVGKRTTHRIDFERSESKYRVALDARRKQARENLARLRRGVEDIVRASKS